MSGFNPGTAYLLGGSIGTNGSGPANADGGDTVARFGRQSDLIVSELQGRYYEQTKRQNTFSMSLTATTTGIAAGNIIGAAAAASTQFAVVNPPNSGKDMVLTKLFVGVISGTTGVPPIGHCAFNGAAVSLAASGTIANNYALGGASSAMKGYASAGGAALTGGGAYSTIRLASVNISAGTFGNLAGTQCLEEIAGDIVIPPGTGWAPCWMAAGSSVLGFYSATWVEVPV